MKVIIRSDPVPKEYKTTGLPGRGGKHVCRQGIYSLDDGNPLKTFRKTSTPKEDQTTVPKGKDRNIVPPHSSYGL